MAEPAPVNPGDVLAGKYRVERVLGMGGMGVVVAATHLELGQTLARNRQAFRLVVLGDNRSASVDSRRFGTVPIADVKGVARQVWFSISAHDGVRWSRLGKVLG